MASTKRSLSEQPQQDDHEDRHTSEAPLSKRMRTEARTVKILVCGDVCGQFERLFGTVAQIDDRHGPFHMLFCVGQFFAASSAQEVLQADTDDAEQAISGDQMQQSQQLHHQGAASEQDMAYITGAKRAPIPTFFIDAASGHDFVESHPDGGDLAKNITFLGRSGVMDLLGLKVAFLSGTFDPFVFSSSSVPTVASYREQDIQRLEQQLEQHAGEVDILLTAEWPAEILRQLHKDQLPKPPRFIDFRKLGSAAVTRVLRKCCPRYHFAALEGAYWERAPYRTHIERLGRNAITRFIAMAQLSESKQKNEKYLYAAGLTPVSDMDTGQLSRETPATTDSPFEPRKHGQRGTDRQVGERQQRGERQRHSHSQQQVQSQSCWFCLSSPKVEKHLLVNICENAYLALPKGGLSEDHTLIVPVKHTSHSLEANVASLQEMAQYKAALRSMFAKEGRQMVVFERYVKLDRVPVHMHYQCIPLPSSVGQQRCQRAFEEEGRKNGLERFEVFGSDVELSKAIRDAGCEGHNYLAIELQDGSKMISRIADTRKGVNFAREVLCQLLGCPDLADWRKCSKSVAEERALVQQLQKKFAPHAFDE